MMSLSPQIIGLIIGGLVPAVLFGLSNVSMKMSTQAGIGTGVYLMITGLGIMAMGLAFAMLQGQYVATPRAALLAFGGGLCWALSVGLITIALVRFQVPLSTLTPLFNMNTLVSVALALWIFAEWQEVKVPQLLIGSFLIVIGGILVARA